MFRTKIVSFFFQHSFFKTKSHINRKASGFKFNGFMEQTCIFSLNSTYTYMYILYIYTHFYIISYLYTFFRVHYPCNAYTIDQLLLLGVTTRKIPIPTAHVYTPLALYKNRLEKSIQVMVIYSLIKLLNYLFNTSIKYLEWVYRTVLNHARGECLS